MHTVRGGVLAATSAKMDGQAEHSAAVAAAEGRATDVLSVPVKLRMESKREGEGGHRGPPHHCSTHKHGVRVGTSRFKSLARKRKNPTRLPCIESITLCSCIQCSAELLTVQSSV